MAVRHMLLHRRIKTQAANHTSAMASAHPDPTMAGAPMSSQVAQVVVQPVNSNYVTLGMQTLAPIFTADGAAVAATGPGRWDQLRAAGRP